MLSNEANIKVIFEFKKPILKDSEKLSENSRHNIEFLSDTSIAMRTQDKSIYKFNFDKIINNTLNDKKDIFDSDINDVTEKVLNGYNGSILLYDKYYNSDLLQEITRKIIPRIFNIILNNNDTEYILKISIFEINNDKIIDLLDINKNDLKLNKDEDNNFYIENITENYINSANDVFSFFDISNSNKENISIKNNLNNESSNYILSLTIIQNNKNETKKSKLLLISNESLTTINKFINKISNNDDNISSKILKNSLGGNCYSLFILSCPNSIINENEILNTLRFGEKIKKIKNNPKINTEMTVDQLKNLVNKLNKEIKNISKKEKSNNKINQKTKLNEEINNKDINIENILNILLNDIKNMEKPEIISKISDIKNKYLSLKSTELNTINSLEEEIERLNEIKIKLQYALIDKETKNLENNNNNNISFSSKNDSINHIIDIVVNFTTDLRQYKEIKKNNEILEKIHIFEEKFQNLGNGEEIYKDLNIEHLYNFEFYGINLKEMKKEEEILKMQKNFDNLKKKLNENIKDKEKIIGELKDEINELKNVNKNLEENVPLNEKVIKEKNILLESNIREMKKKYEESQVKRLILENDIKKLNKILMEKNEMFKNMRNYGVDKNKKNENIPINLVKGINGGKNQK